MVKITMLYALLLLSFVSLKAYGQDSETEEFPEPENGTLKFVMFLTRHGARTPTSPRPTNSTIYFNAWDIYLGDHTQTGNRQHYLLGVKEKKTYIDKGFLSKTFNPKEFMIMSTDFNRTIMSAYSEILGYYPFGVARNMTDNQKLMATPPFAFEGQTNIMKELGVVPTKYGFQPIPIHVGDIDPMMRGMDSDICPYQSTLRHKYIGSDDWNKVNQKYQDILFKEMVSKWNADKNKLDFSSAYPYIDNYYSAWYDQMEVINPISGDAQKQVDDILRDGLYEGFYGLDLAVKLATTRFFNFVHSTLDRKIEALSGSKNVTEFYKDIKLMYLSAHDSTLSAIMSGLYQKQPEQVYFASNFKVELYEVTSGNDEKKYTVRMLFNEKPFNIGTNNTWAEVDWPYNTVKTFLKSREYDGDLNDICMNGSNSNENSDAAKAWLIVLLITAILIVLLNIGYFVMIKWVKKEPTTHQRLTDLEDSDNLKVDLNKSIPNSTRMVSEDSD